MIIVSPPTLSQRDPMRVLVRSCGLEEESESPGVGGWAGLAGVSLTGGCQLRLPGQGLQSQRLPAAYWGDRLLHRFRGRPLQLRRAHAETLPGPH